MKKVYYQLKMFQKSPLRVGSGNGEVTDSDLMIDGRDCPFIPGSSVAGVLRETFSKRVSGGSDQAVKDLFGYAEGKKLSDSHVIISDATGSKGTTASDYIITVRDGIQLDEWGITVSEKKYDFQTVETEKPYYAVLEWTGDKQAYQTEILNGLEPLMKIIGNEGISFGARTTRGYGRMSVSVKRKVFDFPEEIEKWLKFDPFNEEAFNSEIPIEKGTADDSVLTIHADLAINGSFAVRVNTARAEMLEDGSVPDSVPLAAMNGKPVIPGTSWAGTFRHHMQTVLRQTGLANNDQVAKLNLLFGMDEKGGHIRSAFCFGETVLEGGTPYSITRNAVERFTQAPKNMALFTNRFWQGGRGTLDITFRKEKLNKLQSQLLAICLIDLDIGLLTFGGSVGTGHGRCMVEHITVNGTDVTERLKKQDSHFLEGF